MVIVVMMSGAQGRHQFAAKCQKMPENARILLKMPENAGKRRKYHELAISLRGTKYLGGLKIPHPFFRTVEINRGPKLWGHSPLSPPRTFFLASSWRNCRLPSPPQITSSVCPSFLLSVCRYILIILRKI